MFHRLLNLSDSNSFFVFGARGVGKSSLLTSYLEQKSYFLIDLLESEIFQRLQENPDYLELLVNQEKKEWCLIDEIQKVPPLLDAVHRLIEKKKQKFAMTGSSARKLKRASANLLAGRAFVFKLFPLTHLELGEDFNLDQVLNFGSLPKIYQYNSTMDKNRFLKAYADTYLKEEILIEQLIRKLPPFRKFLQLAAIQDTEIVSLSSIARDILSDPKIVSNYYSILEDTLLGFFLEPFHTSIRKRQKHAPKFYWFDLGVRRALSGTLDSPVTPQTFEYGSLFESFLVNEINRILSYSEKTYSLSYIRVDDNQEIDLVIERAGLPTYLVEIKSSQRVNSTHAKSLTSLGSSIPDAKRVVLSNDKLNRIENGVEYLYWKDGIREMGI